MLLGEFYYKGGAIARYKYPNANQNEQLSDAIPIKFSSVSEDDFKYNKNCTLYSDTK